MARALLDTFQNAAEKLALDRDLSLHLAKSRNDYTRFVAWKLARCSDSQNIWFVRDPDNGWLHGRFWKCNHKLCSFCLSSEARRRRRSLLDAIDALPPLQRKWHFLTFTIENPNRSIVATRNVVNDAWSKFRKRGAFAEVRACCKSEEFTITKNGFHYHIHAMLDSPSTYVNGKHRKITEAGIRVKREWTESVESSGGASQNLFGFETYDKYLIVDFRNVAHPKNVVNELGKYITKSTSFRGLSRSTINELAAVKRWNRMFELLGDLRNTKPKTRPSRSSDSYVHTKSLSDGYIPDSFWFEKKRTDSRYFMHDVLGTKFHSQVYDFNDIRRILSEAPSNGIDLGDD
jgi:hypothetical protein